MSGELESCLLVGGVGACEGRGMMVGDGFVVTSMRSSYRGPELSSQHSHWVVHNHLQLHARPLRAPALMCANYMQ